MARFVWYRCPDCGGTFRFLHHPSDCDPPDRCEMCGAWMSDEMPPEEAFVPQAPLIKKSAYAKSVDQTYRAMEETSAQRAEEAAGMLQDQYRADDRAAPHQGDPALLDDFRRDQVAKMRSELKITDMPDPSQMREGDTSVMQKAPQIPGSGFTTFGGGVPNYMPGVGGPGNAEFVSKFTSSHTSRAVNMIKAGRMN